MHQEVIQAYEIVKSEEGESLSTEGANSLCEKIEEPTKKLQARLRCDKSKYFHLRKVNYVYNSVLRKNANKHIARCIMINLPNIQKELLEAFTASQYTNEDLKYCTNILAATRQNEKEGGKKVKRDYGILINSMLDTPCLRIILQHSLEYSLKSFNEKHNNRVHSNNLEVYTQTIKDLLKYIELNLSSSSI